MNTANTLEERLTAGKQLGTLIRIIALGTSVGEYEGKKWERAQIYIEFELPETRRKTGAPFTVGRIFTYSMYEKSHLRKFLNDWCGEKAVNDKAFYLKDLLGFPAMLQIMTHEKENKTIFIVGDVSPIKEQVKAIRTHYDPVYFELDNVFDEFTFSMLPQWTKDRIAKSPEYKRFKQKAK